MDIYENSKKILLRLFLLLLITSCVFLFLGHYQYQNVLHLLVKEEQKVAARINGYIFSNIHSQYRHYGQMLLGDPRVIEAVASGDREGLYRLSKPFFDELRRENPYLKVMHFHTTDNRTLLRVHKPENYGDDLSAIRPIIVRTNETKQPFHGLEAGKYGIYYRITFPIFNHGVHIGSFEFGIDIRHLMELLNEQSVFVPMLLMHKAAIKPVYEFSQKPDSMLKPVNSQYALIHYELSSHDWERLSHLVDRSILHEEYRIIEDHGTDHLMFIATDLKNYLGETIGHFIFIKELNFYTHTIDVIRWISIVAALFLVIVTMLMVKNLLDRHMKHFKSYEEKLLKLNTQLNYVIDGSNLGYWDWYIKSHKHYVNERWMAMLGLTPKDMTFTERDWSDRIHPDDLERVKPVIEKAIEEQAAYSVEYRMRHSDGHYVWIQGSGAVVESDAANRPVRLTGTHQDISERKRLEEENDRNRRYLETLFSQNPNIIVVTDSQKMTDTNEQFFRFFDAYADIEAFQKEYSCICDLFEYRDDPVYLHKTKGNWIEQAMLDDQKQAVIVKEGTLHYFSVTVNDFSYEGERLFLATFTDITQEHMLQEKLERQSIVDELTDVYNRRYFNKVFDKEVRRARRERKAFAFFMIDVDHFKHYNDHYGHDMGDKALAQIAKTLQHSLKRPGDYLFRLGGEEFGVLFSDVPKSKTVDYAEELRGSIEQLCIPHEHNAPHQCITISVGISHTDFTTESHTLTEIYKIADQAIYRAKHKGRNRIEY